MSWQGQMSTVVRYLIDDVDQTKYKYAPKRIETSLLVASQLVIMQADFNNTYTVNVESCKLSPDPSDAETLDLPFMNLTCLRAACIIVGSEIRSESANAIAIKDGPSSIDLRGVTATLTTLYKDLSDRYDKLLLDYKAGNSVAGQAILGPYSPGSDLISRRYTDQRGGYLN